MDWVTELSRNIKSGKNVVIVHFNVDDEVVYEGEIEKAKDVAVGTITQAGKFVRFTPAGFTFDSQETGILFRKMCGLKNPPDPPQGRCPDSDRDYRGYERWQLAHKEYSEWEKFLTQAQEAGLDPVELYSPLPPGMALEFLPRFVAVSRNKPEAAEVAVILDLAENLTPKDDRSPTLPSILSEWASAEGEQSRVLLFARDLTGLDSSLYGRGSAIGTVKIPYPVEEERLVYLKKLKRNMGFKKNGDTFEDIARASSGLTNRHLKSLAQECLAEDKNLTIELVREYKQHVLADELAGLVEFVVPKNGWETVGGLAHVKERMGEIKDAIMHGREWLVPMGILLVGPPGTGKTVLAEAFAKDVGFNFIRLLNVKSKWVGESERNINKVFEIAKSLAPVIIFIDEIDQEGSRGQEGDSGVSQHIFAGILRTMSDTELRGKVMWIGATNRPDMMDPAMKRPGRFDVRIPLLYPDVEERHEIFQAIFRKYDLSVGRDLNFEEFAKLSEGMTGADIECISLNAARFAYNDSRGKVIETVHLQAALDDYIPHHDRKAIDAMTELALAEASSKSLLPRNLKKEEEKPKTLELNFKKEE